MTALFIMIFSASVMASPGCYQPLASQSEDTVQQTKQGYKDGENALESLMQCATSFLQIMSPKDAFNLTCPDGDHPCKNAIKKLCSMKHGVIKASGGASVGMCAPFAFAL